ncbi:MAG: rane-fusion protein [Candidatus Eremiobacteraeota bacterium]|nr:rane-fusion protein [Candidatus Eremiobacteraeota bacterium]
MTRLTRRNAPVLAAVAIVLVAVIAIVFARGRASSAATAAASDATPAPSVSLATARFGTLVTHVRAQGRVGAPAGGDAKLSFAGSGIVARLDAHVGDRVVAGQPLAELDTSGLAIDAAQAGQDATAAAAQYGGGSVPAHALASAQQKLVVARNRLAALTTGSGTVQSDAVAAQGAVRQAQAKVDTDQRTLQREQTLFAGGVAAQKDVDAARQQLALDQADLDAARAKSTSAASGIGGAVAQARADVAQAESDLRSAQAQTTVVGAQAGSAQERYAAAQRNLANAVLRAPADGVVVSVLKHAGEAVDPTQPAIVVGPPRSNQVTVTVTGGAASEIRPGAAATVSVPARALRSPATVRAVVPSVDPTTQTSTVVLSGAPAGAASGDAVDAAIELAAHRGVLIPTDAIVEDPQTQRAIVFVQTRNKDGTAAFVSREVQTGASDGATTLVQSGLRAGERIASRGAFDLLAPGG